MKRFEKIIILDDEVEASLMKDILEDRNIPFMLESYEDLAYNGVFQLYRGWGHIAAEEKYREEIERIYADLNQQDDQEN